MILDNKLEEMGLPYEKGCMMDYRFEEMNQMDCSDYMKSMYPANVRKLLVLVEELCDRMEVDGSTMFDQYPDKVRLDIFVKHLYDSCEGEKDEWVYAMLKVLLVQEMQLRRCRREEWKKRLQEE